MNRLNASLLTMAAVISLAALNVVPNLTTSAVVVAQKSSELYYPGPGESWERRTPQQVGMDPARLNEAIAFALANETKAPRNLELAHYQGEGREPFDEGIGPFKERGDPTGVILRQGYIVAEWGDPQRVDMTFSVTKSFLSTTVGLAYDRKLIRSLQDRVRDYMAPVSPLAPDFGKSRAERLGESSLLQPLDRKSTRLNSSHLGISYAVFCLKKKKK